VSQPDQGLHIVPKFSRFGRALRQDFDARFADPLRASRERFVWDYWNVPGQYTLLRAPLTSLFSIEAIDGFLDELSLWAQEKLGLTTISHPWASCYVEGCEQRFHTDAAHGPWAFVYSLTPASFSKKAQGGFTRIAREFVNQDLSSPREENTMFVDIESRFDRLVVFDPRRPHAVEKVRGVQDVREGRLVIHGWFTAPQPFYDTKLPKKTATAALRILKKECASSLEASRLSWQGLGVLRVDKSAQVAWLSSLIVDRETLDYADVRSRQAFLSRLQKGLDANKEWTKLCRAFGKSRLTLPFECE
jgi:hypothetical protein